MIPLPPLPEITVGAGASCPCPMALSGPEMTMPSPPLPLFVAVPVWSVPMCEKYTLLPSVPAPLFRTMPWSLNPYTAIPTITQSPVLTVSPFPATLLVFRFEPSRLTNTPEAQFPCDVPSMASG